MADIASPVPSSASPLSGLEVLVVDDEPDVRELLVEFFRNKGLNVASATDGGAAIGMLEREPARYGIVVTDLHLPHADGLEVLRRARAGNPSVAVIIITGYASLDSAIQAVRFGAYDYLTKPFSLGQIDVVLQRLRDRLALEAENRRLTRQLAQRAQSDSRNTLADRLEAIEARLSRIEALLKESRNPGDFRHR